MARSRHSKHFRPIASAIVADAMPSLDAYPIARGSTVGLTAENVIAFTGSAEKSAKEVIIGNAANELVFAVVGHVGSGTTEIAKKLISLLQDAGAIGDVYDVSYIKATDLISEWARNNNKPVPTLGPNEKKSISYVTRFQDLGDSMREELKDLAAVAKAFAVRIRQARAEKLQITPEPGAPVRPDGVRRAYVVDSIRHPAEVQLLRHIYQDAFVLVGVVCESDTRVTRVTAKYRDATGEQVERLMERDEKAAEPHGQRVSDAFHLADFFIDNTPPREEIDGTPNRAWDVAEKLSRLVKIIRQKDIIRPLSNETAMWHAFGASMRSACMSRQVGAALVDRQGNVIATGTNEVPRAGGGLYGAGFGSQEQPDHRCAYRSVGGALPYCSNTREQTAIIGELLTSISGIRTLTDAEREKISSLFRRGRIGQLLEFSRAVHAEMDAILAAGRKGTTTIGTHLFVTTFPCHFCARHIVAAGIAEVQYIEPYPKSRALSLHNDSIEVVADRWVPPNSERAASPRAQEAGRKASPETVRVLFRPFAGVAPRLYKRAFLKDGDLKNNITGEQHYSPPEWGSPWHLRKLGYADIEAELSKQLE
jgi:deoxycytidylate deaminase